MKTVILAEKPSQAKAYVDSFAQYTKHAGYYSVNDPILPPNTTVTYGFGHLVELVTPDKYDAKYKRWALKYLPIFPEKYMYTVPYNKKAQFKIVKDLLLAADHIIIATDADREGENIAWSIMRQARVNIQNVKLERLWINSLEKQAIRDGFQNLKPGMDFYPKYQEAMTREISDWLVGMNASPLYSLMLKKYGISGTFSVGRVQTPTLAIVYRRQLEIENFVVQPFQEVQAQVNPGQQPKFTAYLDPAKHLFNSVEVADFMTSSQLTLGPQTGEVISSEVSAKATPSPRLFSLSSLQAQVNRQYKASAAATLTAVQNLYEAKLLTYPRTDTNFITPAEFTYLKAQLPSYKQWLETDIATPNLNPQPRYVNASKVQEHHAIITTRTMPTAKKWASLPELERKIYQLVLRTVVGMFAESAMYDETTVKLQVAKAHFKARGKVQTRAGWQALFPKATTAKPPVEPTVPALSMGMVVPLVIELVDKETQPPVPLTEGTLIMAMKNAGALVDDAEEQAVLKATEGIGTEATRAAIIDKLKQKKYLTSQKNALHVTDLGQVLCQIVATQPLLVSPQMTAKWEVALAQISTGERTSTNFLNQIKKFLAKVITETPSIIAQDTALQAQLQQKQGATKKVVTKLGTCPKCQTGEIVDRGKFYGCTNYAKPGNCDYRLPKALSGKTLPQTALKQLVKTGITPVIKGFKSKNKRSFSAQLKMVDGKIVFIFPNN